MDVKAKKLHDWGVKAFLNCPSGTTRDRSEFVALTVGRQAKRLGFTPDELKKWLQGEYGALWVKHTALNPGLDLKDVQKLLLKAFGHVKESRAVFGAGDRRRLLEAAEGSEEVYLRSYLKRHSPVAKVFRKHRLEVKAEQGHGPSGHGEARQKGEHLIVLYPKFWTLADDRQRDAVLTHEVGHAVLEQYGRQKFIKLAAGEGVDVWDTMELPYAQHNMDEAFADVFAEYYLHRSDLKRRYPAWLKIVEAVLKGQRPGKGAAPAVKKDAGPDYHATAQVLLKANKEKTQEGLHYRAYLRAFLQGQPTEHLTKAFEGARRARADLIDQAGM